MADNELLIEVVQKVAKIEQSLVYIGKEVAETKTFMNDLSHQVTDRNDGLDNRILNLEKMRERYSVIEKAIYLVIVPAITLLVAYGLALLGVV